MTQNKDRKQKIRARMAATGEPYTAAARAISASTGPCGHEYVLGGVAYGCERAPHPIDGYGPVFRHAASIDEELAEGTDEDDGHGPATLVTWGEDSRGDGQDWEIDWGTVEDYPARRRWRGTLQPSAHGRPAASDAAGAPSGGQLTPELDAMENGRYDDDFLADRHVDLDVGEGGGAMTDADYYDRISGAGQNWPFDDRCPRCFGRGWLRTPDSEDYNCPTCEGTGEIIPSRRSELGIPPAGGLRSALPSGEGERKPIMAETGNARTREHSGPCIYCEHGPYCLACPPPAVVEGTVCSRCREQITRSEIAADPYYSGGAAFGDGE